MALFGKKTTADEIIKAVAEMSDDDRQKVRQALANNADEISNADKNTETDKGDAQSTDESAGIEPADGAAKQSEEETTEPEQSGEAPDGEQTAEAEAEPVEETEEEHEAENDVEEAFAARIQSLESEIANLTEMIEKIVSRLEDKPFGSTPEPPQSPDESGDDDRIMRSYYGKTYGRAKV